MPSMCNHVLEHVDDKKALRELARILRPNGVLICTVPIVDGWALSYENDQITEPVDRELHFGQSDHVRIYGRDFHDRLHAAGFEVTEYTAIGSDAVRYGLLPGETVYFCKKLA